MTQHRRFHSGLVLILSATMAAGVGLLLAPGVAIAKKKDKNATRLQTLQTIYVTGNDPTAFYVRQNLEDSTCLKVTPVKDEADAILDVWEETTPCRTSLSRLCLGINAKLVDRKTNKVLWFRTDNDLGSRMNITGSQTAGKWVLWQLHGSCCKGR